MFQPDFATFDTGTVRLNLALAGDHSAPPLICLHGFPEYWGAWREVMADLARDHFVVVPDQRGYNLSGKPTGVEAYRARHLVADLDALADHVAPGRRFALAGHDWGASVAYAYAFAHPDRLSHLVIANGVHPWCFQNAIFNDPAQREASQYINVLRAQEADERMAADGFRRTLRMIEGFSQTGWMTPELRAAYVEAWGRPGALPAMLNWYRASQIVVPAPGEPAGAARVLDMPVEAMSVTAPHLVIWGEADTALLPICLDGLARFAADLMILRIPGAGHWILHEKPAEVAAQIRAFVSAGEGSAAR